MWPKPSRVERAFCATSWQALGEVIHSASVQLAHVVVGAVVIVASSGAVALAQTGAVRWETRAELSGYADSDSRKRDADTI